MRIVSGSLLALWLLATPARAQFQMQITMGLPAVLPPMVVVQPGVRVVSELDEEVYFVDGWYWVRRGPHWYRTHDHRGQWVWVAPARVPVALVRMPPGQYRRLHREEWQRARRERKEREKAERRAWKEREKAERAAWKEGKHGGHDRDD
ncbi:MAG TPA: hypothetical protein VKB92_15890 [Myxococcales bacterium]|nr:hypothetical protein [Myxococcales bacterium]